MTLLSHSVTEGTRRSVSHPCGVFVEMTHFAFWSNQMYSDSVLPGSKIMQASLLYLNDMPSISLWTESGPEPAAGHRSLLTLSLFSTMPVPFTIEQENSHQCSGSVCTRFNTYRKTTCCTELVLYSVPVTKCQPVTGMAKNVSAVCCLLLGLCCPQYCEQ